MKKLTAILLCAGMALSLAACGNNAASEAASSAASEATEETASSAASEAEEEATSESVEETVSEASSEAAEETGEIKLGEEGKLHMATNAAFPPYELTNDEGGYEGIDVEIATKIAEKLGLELVVDDMDFQSVIAAAQSGKSDIAMAGLTVSEERKQNVDFTDTYATGVQVIIVPEDSPIQSVDDLSSDTLIGCQEATTGYLYCSDDYGEDAVNSYTNGATAIQALLSGKVDCVVIDNEPAKAFVAANEGLKILDTEYVKEDYAIGISKDNPALLEAVNGALKELIEDGTVQEIIDKYIPAE
ncbi:MAG: amino acid ABC transporter substrate-binding protein [Eubacterium sp.]|nr:amino acid ABC transporter substrate-binding protein [Eubacterium sp.]